MKLAFACLLLCLTTTPLLSQSTPDLRNNENAKVVPPISASNADPKAQARILDQYGKLPLSFEGNQGQTDSRVKFLSRTSGYSLFLTGDEAVLVLSAKKAITNKAKIEGAAHKLQSGMAEPKSGAVLRMKLRNANPAAKLTGVDELAGTSNYFIGNDPAKWRTGVPTYAKVKYDGIYSGIDMVYYGNQRQLEYDFIVAPGADPRRIAFDVRGAKRIRRDAHGDLVLKLGEDEIRWHKPVVYQEKNGTRHEIAARYAITDRNRVGFEVAKYDASRALYIDPLIYSTYLGGSALDAGRGIAADSAGNAYVTGWTESPDFPATPGAFSTTLHGSGNAFVSKLNPTGSALLYSTYLGGSGGDIGYGIAVDGTGNGYVTGSTGSSDFPVVNPLQPAYGGSQDAFVAKINPTGSALLYSTYLGGSGGDLGYGIAVDGAGNAYVTGITGSTNFPTMNPLQGANGGGYDAFVAKINASGSAFVYSTYLGGSGGENGYGVSADSSGNAYVTGVTLSTNFPTTPGAFQTICNGGTNCDDAFITKIDPTGSAFVYSTYLGGSAWDQGQSIAVDSSGNAYVTGLTQSTDFPVTPGAFQTICNGGTNCATDSDAFASKLNPTGSALIYSTYLGGSGIDWGTGIAVGGSGNAYVTGVTYSQDFPTAKTLQSYGGVGDAFVMQLDPTGSALLYSTYLGGSGQDYSQGIAIDSAGNAYVAGATGSTDFPITPGAFQTICNGGTNCSRYGDAFVSKIYLTTSGPYGVVSPTTVNFGQVLVGQTSPQQRVSLKNTGTSELIVSSISISGYFALPVNHCAAGVKPGTHCDVFVTFTPHALETETGTLTFVDNASNSPQTVSLTGVGANTVPTKTTITASPKSIYAGQPITFTATVASLGGGVIPDGEQVYFETSYGGLGYGTLQSGVAILTTTNVRGIGQFTENIQAQYGGDQSFYPSSGGVDISVSKWPITITLTSNPNPSLYNDEPIIFTAQVTSNSPVAPTGNIYFSGYYLNYAGMHNGIASITAKSNKGVGSYVEDAAFHGDHYNAPGQAALTQVVNPTTTTTSIKSSKNPSPQGQAVTFSVIVKAPWAHVVYGSVTFTSGATTLGTVGLSNSRGSITAASLPVGQNTITATYTPANGNFLGSSGSLVQTVQ